LKPRQNQRDLFGKRIVALNWRLFCTLVRHIVDYPNLLGYLQNPYQPTRHRRDGQLRSHQAPLLRHARRHQPAPHRALGPALDLTRPHGWARLT